MDKILLLLNKLIPDFNLDLSILNNIQKSYQDYDFNYQINSYQINLEKDHEKESIESFISNNFKIKKKKISCPDFWNNNPKKTINQDKFISEQGIKEINKKMNKNLKIIIYDEKINIFYDIYFQKLEDILEFLKQLDILIRITIFIFYEINTSDNNKIDCNFFLTDIKKKINWDLNETLGINHVNSGLTSKSFVKKNACDKNTYILIWRKEELFKVYIHELIHFFDIDFNHLNNNKKIFAENFCLSKEIKLIPNEAITDFTAIILKSVFYSHYEKKYTLEKILQYEIKFILFQAIKILKYYNYNSWDDFSKKDSKECRILFTQKSSIFSYYILKALMFFNFNKTINLLKQINNKESFYLNYNSNPNNFSKIIELQINSVKNGDSFQKLFQRVVESFNFKRYSNKKIVNTIRMSLFEL